MKKIQEVWAEITAKKAEVALSAKKLQLSALDDVKAAMQILERDVNAMDSIKGRFGSANSAIRNAENAVMEIRDDIDMLQTELNGSYEKAQDALEEFSELANELGVKASDNKDWADLDFFLRNDFDDTLADAETYYNELNAVVKALENIDLK
jgi:chromosome segregation ATPase